MAKVSSTPPGLNPILAKAAQDAANTKQELRTFMAGNDLKVLADSEMARGGFWPKEERLPIGIPEIFLRKSIGLSPNAVVTALAMHGVEKLENEKVEVFWDPIAKKSFVRLYVPNPFGTTDFDGNPASNVYIKGRWLEIAPKAEIKAPKVTDPNAPKVPIAERIAAAVEKTSNDPRLGQIKALIQKSVNLKTDDGAPINPNDLWKRVSDAATTGTPSKLEELSWALAGAMASKGGDVDWKKTEGKAALIHGTLLAQTRRHVLADGTPNPEYRSLEQLAEGISAAVDASDAAGKPTVISSPKFKAELEGLTGAKFVATDAPQLIGNGENQKALETRLAVINGAKTDINYAMWKMYPDEAGKQSAAALMAAAKRGVKVNVVVDGNLSSPSRDAGAAAMLNEMRDAGVNVLEWKDPQNPLNGMHAKMILADCSTEAQAAAKASGQTWAPVRLATDRNDGTQYLFDKGADSDSQRGWSGVDLLFKGGGAASGLEGFRAIYNSQAAREGKPLMGESSVPKHFTGAAAGGAEQVLSVADVAGPNNPQGVSKAMEKLLNGVQKGEKLRIDQAYFLKLPGIEAAIKNAIKRGVNVEILTNSAESCDVPGINAMTTAILQRLSAEATDTMNSERGQLKMYEYKGKQTLHDKMIVFGNKATMRMSFNQHGRSQQHECEEADVVLGAKTAAAAAANFDKIVGDSNKVREILSPRLSADEASVLPLLESLVGDAT